MSKLEIKNYRDPNFVLKTIGELEYGDLFVFPGGSQVYMRAFRATDSDMKWYINLSNADTRSSPPDVLVYCVHAELVWEYEKDA